MNDSKGIVQQSIQPLLERVRQLDRRENVSKRFVISVNHQIIPTPHISMEATKRVNDTEELLRYAGQRC